MKKSTIRCVLKRILCLCLMLALLSNDAIPALEVQAEGTVTEATGDTDGSGTEDSDEEADEEASDEEEAEDENFEIIDDEPLEEAVLVQELENERSLYSKQYLLSDQSRAIVLYTDPVHYETESGTLAEIDNSLMQTSRGYTNVANSYKVWFFQDKEENGGFEEGEVCYQEKGYEIRWVYLEPTVSGGDSVSGGDVVSGGDSVSGSDAVSGGDSDNSGEPDSDEGLVSGDDAVSSGAALQFAPAEGLHTAVTQEAVDGEEEEELGHVTRQASILYDGYQNGVSLEYAPQS